MHTDGGSNKLQPDNSRPRPELTRDAEHPGYEVQDVNVGGIVTFVAGLSGFLVIFFVFCFVMGKAINTGILKEDGRSDQWHQGEPMHENEADRKREDLTSNAALEQREYSQMTKKFPTPRLQTDDGNQDTTDLHAREDLLLNYYSIGSGLPAGKVRIPVDRAMALIVQRGLPQAANQGQPTQTAMVGDDRQVVTAPLTTGFARTGYELDQIASREQKLEFNEAEAKK